MGKEKKRERGRKDVYGACMRSRLQIRNGCTSAALCMNVCTLVCVSVCLCVSAGLDKYVCVNRSFPFLTSIILNEGDILSTRSFKISRRDR